MAAKKHTTDPTQLDLSFGPTEEWRDVPGYEGYYEVSNLGRVRSLDRYVRAARYAPTMRLHKGGILRLSGHCKDGRHYLNVAFCKEGIIRKQEIHILVLSTFLAQRPLGMVANHIDGDRTNNAINNLEWVTSKRNSRHAVEIGAIGVGERSQSAKLTEAHVQEIRRMAGAGLSSRQVGEQFGVTPSNIQAIWLRKSWKHLP